MALEEGSPIYLRGPVGWRRRSQRDCDRPRCDGSKGAELAVYCCAGDPSGRCSAVTHASLHAALSLSAHIRRLADCLCLARAFRASLPRKSRRMHLALVRAGLCWSLFGERTRRNAECLSFVGLTMFSCASAPGKCHSDPSCDSEFYVAVSLSQRCGIELERQGGAVAGQVESCERAALPKRRICFMAICKHRCCPPPSFYCYSLPLAIHSQKWQAQQLRQPRTRLVRSS